MDNEEKTEAIPVVFEAPEEPYVVLCRELDKYNLKPYNKEIIIDGDFHNFVRQGSKHTNKSCWYIFQWGESLSEHYKFIWGAFGDRRGEEKHTICTLGGERFSTAQWERIQTDIRQKQREREEKDRIIHERISIEVNEIWQKLPDAELNHPYLLKKHIAPIGIRQENEALVIPYYDSKNDRIMSIQKIFNDGFKQNYEDGQVKGCYFPLGDIESASKIFLCEGYATGVSIYNATNTATVCCFSCWNYPYVIENIRLRLPNTKLIIVCDHDEPKSNFKIDNVIYGASEFYAKKSNVEDYIIIPLFEGEVANGQDANDYVNKGGDLKTLLLGNIKTTSFKKLSGIINKQVKINWLVNDLIPEKSIGMLVGESGVGKSFIVDDLMLTIAVESEDNWASRNIEHGQVLYLCGEGVAGFRQRANAWAMYRGLHTEPDMFDNFIYYVDNLILDNQAQLRNFVVEMKDNEIKPKLIVVDTLSCYLKGNDREEQDINNFFRGIKYIASEFDTSILIVHHTSKDKTKPKTPIGSSLIKGHLDYLYLAERMDDNEDVIRISCDKMKDGEKPLDIYGQIVSQELYGFRDNFNNLVKSAYFNIIEAPVMTKKQEQIENRKIRQINELATAFVNGSGFIDEDNRYIFNRDMYRQKLLSTGINKGFASHKASVNLSDKQSILAPYLANKTIDFIIDKKDKYYTGTQNKLVEIKDGLLKTEINLLLKGERYGEDRGEDTSRDSEIPTE